MSTWHHLDVPIRDGLVEGRVCRSIASLRLEWSDTTGRAFVIGTSRKGIHLIHTGFVLDTEDLVTFCRTALARLTPCQDPHTSVQDTDVS